MDDNGSVCKVTVDGTDFKINEPTPFDSKWYSHKIKHAAVRYEVVVSIQKGWIVAWNGPYPAGKWSDLKIARHSLVHELDPGEKVLADKGYRDSSGIFVTPTGGHTNLDRMKADARARHETINVRVKCWKILEQRYRHNVSSHGMVFGAVVNIVQLVLQYESPAYQVIYKDN